MNEKDIRAAFEQIEPPDGAQERMYQNILKKAATQQSAPKKTVKPVWQRYAALAACLVLVITAGFFAFRSPTAQPELTGDDNNDPPVMAVSPFEDLQSADEFSRLGFTIDAPEGASDVTYSIAYGDTALVSFTLNGCEYRYEASKEEVFSETAEETPVIIDGDAVWKTDSVQYRLSAYAASEEALLQLAGQLSQT